MPTTDRDLGSASWKECRVMSSSLLFRIAPARVASGPDHRSDTLSFRMIAPSALRRDLRRGNTGQLGRLWAAVLWLSMGMLSAENVIAAETSTPAVPAKTWNGYVRHEVDIEGHLGLVIAPREPAAGQPWVWHGEFFGHQPEPDLALLGRGWHIVYLKVSDQFGSPRAVELWNRFYERLRRDFGLGPRAALVGVSRGGLYCYNWAARNPDCVACIFGDAPVCDVRSWPAGMGTGTGNPIELERLKAVYQVTDNEALFAKAWNPIDLLEPLAKAGVPLLHVYGDADRGVPWEENTGVLAERYRALGGSITLIAKPGVGHVHGLEDCTPIVEFIDLHSRQQGPKSGQLDGQPPAPLALGSRLELMVDYGLIERLEDAELFLHEPRDEGVAFPLDLPWEGPLANYTTIIRDHDRFRAYYRGISQPGLDGSEHERTCLAESLDGRVWTKPQLGLFEFGGSRENNIVLANRPPITHNFCPLIDGRPGVEPAERYKAVGGTGHELFGFVSADGLQWRQVSDQPLLSSATVPIPHTHLFDSQNLVFWSDSEQCYVCYFRVWDGQRRVARSTSLDFRSWTPAVLMEQRFPQSSAQIMSALQEHLYTNQTSPYFRAPHLYIATPARFFEGRQVLTREQAEAIQLDPSFFHDTSDSVFLTSRGGNVYDRVFLTGHLKPGIGPRNWVSRTNYPALNVVQSGPTEMSMYVNQDYAQPTAHVRRFSLRLDGFASVRAGTKPGLMVTRPLVFDGRELTINFATSAGGGLFFELQDVSGHPLPGWTFADCQEQIGNEIERVVSWKNGNDLSAVAGRPLRLAVRLIDADLFALRFR
jgi:pimeloyl-ACP methyl ester carboxylesterase